MYAYKGIIELKIINFINSCCSIIYAFYEHKLIQSETLDCNKVLQCYNSNIVISFQVRISSICKFAANRSHILINILVS